MCPWTMWDIDGLYETLPDRLPVLPRFYQVPAFWAWVGVIVGVLVFDLIQLHRHGWTMSGFLQHLGKAHTIARWLVLIIWGLAGWHFGWGF